MSEAGKRFEPLEHQFHLPPGAIPFKNALGVERRFRESGEHNDVFRIFQRLRPELLTRLAFFPSQLGVGDLDGLAGFAQCADAPRIHLDYNLTTPEKTTAHIEAILDAHARYAGLASIRRLCSSTDVLPRLTWVSAGVPRDAIYLFAQAIQKANVEARGRVTVSNVNQSASETLTIKLRDLEQDASEQATGLKIALETIKTFCIKEKRQNAFLIEIDNESDLFQQVNSLVQLRLLHVISEGITPHEAGRKYLALILDYGLYIGIRAAQSVELFNKSFEDSSSATLRKLPILRAQ